MSTASRTESHAEAGRSRPKAALLRSGLRRSLYALLALPAGLATLVLAAVGAVSAARAANAKVQSLIDLPVDPTVSRGRLTVYGLIATPLNAVTAIPAAYLWAVLVLNLAYPLRPDTVPGELEGAWGGPTMAGAWTVHAVGAVALFLIVGVPLMALLAGLQARIARKRLGAS